MSYSQNVSCYWKTIFTPSCLCLCLPLQHVAGCWELVQLQRHLLKIQDILDMIIAVLLKDRGGIKAIIYHFKKWDKNLHLTKQKHQTFYEMQYISSHKSLLWHNNPLIKKFGHYPLWAPSFVMIASQPIRGQYSGHVMTLDQSEAWRHGHSSW